MDDNSDYMKDDNKTSQGVRETTVPYTPDVDAKPQKPSQKKPFSRTLEVIIRNMSRKGTPPASNPSVIQVSLPLLYCRTSSALHRIKSA